MVAQTFKRKTIDVIKMGVMRNEETTAINHIFRLDVFQMKMRIEPIRAPTAESSVLSDINRRGFILRASVMPIISLAAVKDVVEFATVERVVSAASEKGVIELCPQE
mgnify:CR=1 FL=1